jgi:hypothetical protein
MRAEERAVRPEGGVVERLVASPGVVIVTVVLAAYLVNVSGVIVR